MFHTLFYRSLLSVMRFRQRADNKQQYRLHRSPSTRLVMDLLQVQEELNIIIQMKE
ncbi:hypothetical protein BJ546DRAFT_182391 [Cryomyces antarcticus]